MKAVKIMSFFLCLSSINAIAEVETVKTTLTRVATTWAADGVIVQSVDLPINTSCSQPKFLMSSSNLMLQENLSILLSAFHSGSVVALSVEGCNNSLINLISVGLRK